MFYHNTSRFLFGYTQIRSPILFFIRLFGLAPIAKSILVVILMLCASLAYKASVTLEVVVCISTLNVLTLHCVVTNVASAVLVLIYTLTDTRKNLCTSIALSVLIFINVLANAINGRYHLTEVALIISVGINVRLGSGCYVTSAKFRKI